VKVREISLWVTTFSLVMMQWVQVKSVLVDIVM